MVTDRSTSLLDRTAAARMARPTGIPAPRYTRPCPPPGLPGACRRQCYFSAASGHMNRPGPPTTKISGDPAFGQQQFLLGGVDGRPPDVVRFHGGRVAGGLARAQPARPTTTVTSSRTPGTGTGRAVSLHVSPRPFRLRWPARPLALRGSSFGYQRRLEPESGRRT